MKKLICIVLVLMMVLPLAACESEEEKLEKQVTEDVCNELNHIYVTHDIEVTIRKTKVDGDYYYIEGKIVMECYTTNWKIVCDKTTFEAKYVNQGGSFQQIYLNIDDDWSRA